MTTSPAPLPAAPSIIAKHQSGVCDAGERGVCYESFIFEQGRYDGFSPEDVGVFPTVTGAVCRTVTDYQFTSVTRLPRDFEQGRFAAAFPARQRGRFAPEPL